MKNLKGISLIVLIITIIVMIIIAGAIIITLTQTGIIDQAEEATFKTQVRGIQDALLLKKASILAETEGNVSTYDLDLADLGLETETYEEFKTKLYISDAGELFYQTGNVTDKEEQWLIDLGIQGGHGLVTGNNFVSDVTIISKNNATPSGYPNYVAIVGNVKDYYPNTAVLVINKDSSELPGDATQMNELLSFYSLLMDAAKYLEDTYEKDTVVNDTIEQEVRDKLGGDTNKNKVDNLEIFTSNNLTIEELISNMYKIIETVETYRLEYILINGEDKLKVTSSGVSEYVPDTLYTIVNETEAAQFTYTESEDTSEGRMVATITGFNNTSSKDTIKVPSLIIKDSGDVVFVTKIATGALTINKPMYLEIYSTLMEYAAQRNLNKTYEQTTLAELAALSSSVGGGTDTTNYTDDMAGKNQFLLDNFLPALISGGEVENYFIVEGSGANMKVYGIADVDEWGTPTFHPLTTDYVEAPDIIISEGIEEIESGIVANRFISYIYIPTTLASASSTAFSDSPILKVKSRMTFAEVCDLDSDAAAGIFGSKCIERNFEQIQ